MILYQSVGDLRNDTDVEQGGVAVRLHEAMDDNLNTEGLEGGTLSEREKTNYVTMLIPNSRIL